LVLTALSFLALSGIISSREFYLFTFIFGLCFLSKDFIKKSLIDFPENTDKRRCIGYLGF